MRVVKGKKLVTRNLMKTSFWFKDFPSSILSELIVEGEYRNYFKSEIIHSDLIENELVFIISGTVWAYLNNQKFGVLKPSDLIGVSAVLDNPNHELPLFVFKAEDDCEVLALSRDLFLRKLNLCPGCWQPLAKASITYSRYLVRWMIRMQTGPIETRVLNLLYRLSINELMSENSDAPIAVDMTQEDLAMMTHSSRQYVNKALRYLEKENLVHIGYKKIVIVDRTKFLKSVTPLFPVHCNEVDKS